MAILHGKRGGCHLLTYTARIPIMVYLQAQRHQIAGNTTKAAFAQLKLHLLPRDQKGAELTLTALLACELLTSKLNCMPPANSD